MGSILFGSVEHLFVHNSQRERKIKAIQVDFSVKLVEKLHPQPLNVTFAVVVAMIAQQITVLFVRGEHRTHDIRGAVCANLRNDVVAVLGTSHHGGKRVAL